MKGNKFLAALLAASMTFSVVPATALNVFADELVGVAAADTDVTVASKTAHLSTINSKAVSEFDDDSDAITIAKAINGVNENIAAATSDDAIKSAIQNDNGFTTAATTVGKTLNVTGSTVYSGAGNGTITVEASDGTTYVFAYTTLTEVGTAEKDALDEIFKNLTAITYDGKTINTAVVQKAFDTALTKAKASTDAYWGTSDGTPNGTAHTGHTFTYSVESATVSSDGNSVTGRIVRTGTATYYYNYSAKAVQNSDSARDVVSDAVNEVAKNVYPNFGTTYTDDNSGEDDAVIDKVTKDINDLLDGKATAALSNVTVDPATRTSNGTFTAKVNTKLVAFNLKYSSTQKLSDSDKSVEKALKNSGAVTESTATLTDSDGAPIGTNGAKAYLTFASNSNFSHSLQKTTDTTPVSAETVRAAVEKAVTNATKDYSGDGVTYKVESVDGKIDLDGSDSGAAKDAQTKATAGGEGAYVVKVTASIANDFYGYPATTGVDTTSETAKNVYYVVVKTPELKAVATKSISLADKTYIRKLAYKYDADGNGTVKAVVDADVIEIKPTLTPADANDTVTWSVINTDGTPATTAFVAANGNGTTTDATLTDAKDKAVTIGANDGKIIVTKAGTYKVTATAASGAKATMTLTVKDNFNDVSKTAYFSDAVAWAYKNDITAGTTESTFGSYDDVTRGQFVTWLYKYAVSKDPSVEIADSDVKATFSDVPTGKFYAKAVQWAAANKITAGTTATTFSPDQKITRAQALTMLWRAMGSPTVGEGSEYEQTLKFTDLPTNPAFRTAMVWAIHEGVTYGTTPTTCSPENICPRSQAITFIYGANKKYFPTTTT